MFLNDRLIRKLFKVIIPKYRNLISIILAFSSKPCIGTQIKIKGKYKFRLEEFKITGGEKGISKKNIEIETGGKHSCQHLQKFTTLDKKIKEIEF